MSERLWEVAEGTSGRNLDFLRKQADIIAEGQEVLEGPLRVVDFAASCQTINCPEAAYAEGTLL